MIALIVANAPLTAIEAFALPKVDTSACGIAIEDDARAAIIPPRTAFPMGLT